MTRRIVLLGALLAVGCGRGGSRPTSPGAPVFVFSIDTLRADRLPVYGYGGVETPAIDAFRRDAVLFANAYSHTPLTLPSHATLLTGLLPGAHGIRDNLGYRLARGTPTLASFLGGRGYRTGAAVSSIVLLGASGLADGFERYDDDVEATAPDLSLSHVQRDGDRTVDAFAGWLAAGDVRPPFGFVHVYEPHTPYDAPEPYRSRYGPGSYDGEVARADAVFGRFVALLKDRGLFERALVVLVSDHGEGLGDHGEDEHGVTLYRETLHVPLLVKLPGAARAGESIATPVGLADLLPTIAAVVAPGEPPSPGLVGTDVLALAPGADRAIYGETFFPRLHYGWSELASLVDARHHYIDSPRPELFDLTRDPGETADVSGIGAGALHPALRSMRLAVDRARVPLAPPSAVDPEHAAKLASLGYLGSGVTPSAGPLPDPKEKLESLKAMKRAFSLLNDGRSDEAVGAFRSLVGREPSMVDSWLGLSRAYRKAGRTVESLEALKKVVALSPDARGEHLLSVAALALEAGRLDEAESHARLALGAGNTLAHETLALVALSRGDLEAARREVAESRRASPNRRFPLLLEVKLLLAERRWEPAREAAERLLHEGEARRLAPLQGANQAEGEALARLGEVERAEASFREELRLFPDNLTAWQHLAVLLASAGRADECAAIVARLERGPASARLAARTLSRILAGG